MPGFFARYGFRNAKSYRVLTHPYLVRDSIPKTPVYLQPLICKIGTKKDRKAINLPSVSFAPNIVGMATIYFYFVTIIYIAYKIIFSATISTILCSQPKISDSISVSNTYYSIIPKSRNLFSSSSRSSERLGDNKPALPLAPSVNASFPDSKFITGCPCLAIPV